MGDDSAVRWSFGTQDEDDSLDQPISTPTRKGKKRTDAHVFAPSGYGYSLPLSSYEEKGKSVGVHPQAILRYNTPTPSTAPLAIHTPFAISKNSSSSYSLSLSSYPNPNNSISSSRSNSMFKPFTLPKFAPARKPGKRNPLDPDDQEPTPLTKSDHQVRDDANADPMAENILRPVQHDLKRLRTLMKPEAYPTGDSGIKVKPYLRVVSERLLPIGEYIVAYVQGDGAMELRLCRCIANSHWPLPTNSGTHLHIQATYRNALYLRKQRESRPPPPPPQEQAKQSLPPPPSPSGESIESAPESDDMPPLEPGSSFKQEVKEKITKVATMISDAVTRNNTSKPKEEKDEVEESEHDGSW